MSEEISDLDPEVLRRVVEPSADAFRRLVALMAKLRRDCPWDREQTHRSLARHLVEETYETLEAIETDDLPSLREELGDVLIQVVFHSQLAFEEDAFTVSDVVNELCEKLIRRHPHVFGDVQVAGAVQVRANWDEIKRGEKGAKSYGGIPRALPALARAAKMQRRTAELGLTPDWDSEDVIFEALDEEIAELRSELGGDDRDPQRVEAELGDILFVAAALGNKLGVDPEDALRRMLERSDARLRTVERLADGHSLESLSPEEWRRYWEHAKQENP